MQTIPITLGGDGFNVPVLTIGDLEKIVEAAETMPRSKMPFAILRIALARHDPPFTAAAVDAMTATFEEVRTAVEAISIASGLSPNAAAPAAGA